MSHACELTFSLKFHDLIFFFVVIRTRRVPKVDAFFTGNVTALRMHLSWFVPFVFLCLVLY